MCVGVGVFIYLFLYRNDELRSLIPPTYSQILICFNTLWIQLHQPVIMSDIFE